MIFQSKEIYENSPTIKTFNGKKICLEETQIKSRIERDVNQRGYTREEAMTLF
jgi:hypothetical protein